MTLQVIREVTIGEFILTENGPYDLFWLKRTDGEGMELNEETLSKLEKVISDFYMENF